MRQGCASSPLCCNRKITGVAINVNDVLLYFKTPEESLPEVKNCLKNIGPMTGCKLTSYNYSPREKPKQADPLKWKTKLQPFILKRQDHTSEHKLYNRNHQKISVCFRASHSGLITKILLNRIKRSLDLYDKTLKENSGWAHRVQKNILLEQ